jgi:hypothetical protein
MTTTETQVLYRKWLDATNAKTEFWTENYKNWGEEVDKTYHTLNTLAETCYYEWLAAKTGKTVEQVAYGINEKIHSRFD